MTFEAFSTNMRWLFLSQAGFKVLVFEVHHAQELPEKVLHFSN